MKRIVIFVLTGLTSVAHSDVQLTTPEKQARVSGFAELNMSKDASAKPGHVGFDIEVGVLKNLSLSVFHSNSGATGFLAGLPTMGVCLRNDGPCPSRYMGGGGQIRYGLMSGNFAAALEAGGYYQSGEFFKGKAGLVFGLTTNNVSFLIAPNVAFGLNKRSAGNEDVVSVPVTLSFAAGGQIAIGAQTGVSVDALGEAGKSWRAPVGGYVSFLLLERFQLWGAFSVLALTGGDNVVKGIDNRAMTAGVAISL